MTLSKKLEWANVVNNNELEKLIENRENLEGGRLSRQDIKILQAFKAERIK